MAYQRDWVSCVHVRPTPAWLLQQIEAKVKSDAEVEAANDDDALANLIFPDWDAFMAEAIGTSTGVLLALGTHLCICSTI